MRDAPPLNWLVLVVCIRNEHVYARVSLWYLSNNIDYMGPPMCVDEPPLHEYHRYHRYTYCNGCLNGTAECVIGYHMNRSFFLWYIPQYLIIWQLHHFLDHYHTLSMQFICLFNLEIFMWWQITIANYKA